MRAPQTREWGVNLILKQVREEPTLEVYVKFVESKGRQRFLRTPTGSGCLHHVKILLADTAEVKMTDKRNQGYKSALEPTRRDVEDKYFIVGGECTYF